MNPQAYQIDRDRRVLVARPSRVECSGKDIAGLVVELCRRIDAGEADSVVVDLCNVHHMDSCCIGRLLVLRQHARDAGGSVALARCLSNVQFLFEMTRLDRAFGLYETTKAAVAELRERRTTRQAQTRFNTPHSPGDQPKPRHGYAPQLVALLRAHQRLNPARHITQAHDRS